MGQIEKRFVLTYHELLDKVVLDYLSNKEVDTDFIRKKLSLILRAKIRESVNYDRLYANFEIVWQDCLPRIEITSINLTTMSREYLTLDSTSIQTDLDNIFHHYRSDFVDSYLCYGIRYKVIQHLYKLFLAHDNLEREEYMAAALDVLDIFAAWTELERSDIELPILFDNREYPPDEWPTVQIKCLPVQWTKQGYVCYNNKCSDVINFFQTVKDIYYGIKADV